MSREVIIILELEENLKLLENLNKKIKELGESL